MKLNIQRSILGCVALADVLVLVSLQLASQMLEPTKGYQTAYFLPCVTGNKQEAPADNKKKAPISRDSVFPHALKYALYTLHLTPPCTKQHAHCFARTPRTTYHFSELLLNQRGCLVDHFL